MLEPNHSFEPFYVGGTANFRLIGKPNHTSVRVRLKLVVQVLEGLDSMEFVVPTFEHKPPCAEVVIPSLEPSLFIPREFKLGLHNVTMSEGRTHRPFTSSACHA